MFRVPPSFGVGDGVAPTAVAVGVGLVLAGAPTQDARTGATAAAATPLRSVLRLIFVCASDSVTCNHLPHDVGEVIQESRDAERPFRASGKAGGTEVGLALSAPGRWTSRWSQIGWREAARSSRQGPTPSSRPARGRTDVARPQSERCSAPHDPGPGAP